MQKKGAFDYILLEATGLADPGGMIYIYITWRLTDNTLSGPIASMFWQNEEYSSNLGADIRLDSVVCVVDAMFGLKVVTYSILDVWGLNYLSTSKWKRTKQAMELGRVYGTYVPPTLRSHRPT
jgi:hypothetical protein